MSCDTVNDLVCNGSTCIAPVMFALSVFDLSALVKKVPVRGVIECFLLYIRGGLCITIFG